MSLSCEWHIRDLFSIKTHMFFVFLNVFLHVVNLAASAAKYCEKEAVNQSAASAASPDYVKFQAVIRPAASAATRKPKSREGSSRGVQDGSSAGGRLTASEHSPGASFPGFGLPGGCASSRLDHSFHISSRTHARQPLSVSCSTEII